MHTIEPYLQALCAAEQERLRYLLQDLRLCRFARDDFRFLDMGAGSGTMSAGVLLLFAQSQGTLVDIQDRFNFPESVLEQIAGRYHFVPWKEVDSIRDAKFDLVVSTDVLEHIPNWTVAFNGLCQHLNPGGYLYVQVPSNYPSPNHPSSSVIKQRLLGVMGKNDPNLHVRHGLSCKQLFDEAKQQGLQAILAAEDYVVDGIVHCDFKPRCHCLFQRPSA